MGHPMRPSLGLSSDLSIAQGNYAGFSCADMSSRKTNDLVLQAQIRELKQRELGPSEARNQKTQRVLHLDENELRTIRKNIAHLTTFGTKLFWETSIPRTGPSPGTQIYAPAGKKIEF